MSGVEQMKIPGNTAAKSPEERNIPWSQQVDEASYENLASPSTDDNSAANQSSMQFQYPPFNAKENQNTPWNNFNKSRKPSNLNYDTNKKYGKPGLYNNAKREDYQPNAWASRRIIAENSSGNFNRSIRNDEGHSAAKLDNRPNEAVDESKTPAAPAAVPAAKKTTWASIASQPAKLTARTTLITSSHKKKGPGMPPPPMVPGKHNLDVNTWDMPNNNPPPIPSPPPPIDLSCADINADFSLSVNSSEPALGARPDKGHSKNVEFIQKDDNNKVSAPVYISNNSSNNSNFGRVRSSPNGHTRKHWSTQHPLHQQPRPSVSGGGTPGPSGPPIRRSDAGGSGGGITSNRYGSERRVNYTISRSEHDGGNARPYEFRDEDSSKNAERTSNVAEVSADPQALLEELRVKNNYNPAEIDLEKASSTRFFVIKSYSEDDIHRSIKYEIWCSTDHGNKRLDDAFKERHKDGGNIMLFFSVNGSGHFCGMAQMMTAVDYNSTSSVWSQDKWKGKFKVKWVYVKDVPNAKLRHIRLENNDNKSVTNSRDAQEVPNAQGIEVLQILHAFKHSTSIFDDFSHYEKKQEEEISSKRPPFYMQDSTGGGAPQIMQSPINRHFNRQNDDRDRERDSRDSRGIGSGPGQKYFDRGSGGSSSGGFRERNNTVHRSGGGGFHGSGSSNNYNNDYRRGFDSQRTMGGSDYQQKERESAEPERDWENDFGGRHITTKFEYNRWDDHTQTKPRINLRDRDFNTDQNKSDTRYKAGIGTPRDLPKENDKNRSSDY